MRYFTLLLLISTLTFVSCNKDDDMDDATGSLEINYKLVYEGEPLVMNETLDYPNDLRINFSRVNMFLADFKLGQEELGGVTFLDFTNRNTSESNAEAGLLLMFDDIPVGNYSSFNMGVGLPEDINSTLPSDYESGHPLAKTSEYWEGWDSYIFAKYEGKVDLDNNDTLDTGLTFHTGTDEVYRELTFNKPIDINANETTQIILTLDAKKIFRINDNSYLNLREIQGTHNPGEVDVMKEMSDNYSTAFTIQ